MNKINTGDRFKINMKPYLGKTFTATKVIGEHIAADCGDGISYGFTFKSLSFYGNAVQIVGTRAKSETLSVQAMNEAPYLKQESNRKPERVGNIRI